MSPQKMNSRSINGKKRQQNDTFVRFQEFQYSMTIPHPIYDTTGVLDYNLIHVIMSTNPGHIMMTLIR